MNFLFCINDKYVEVVKIVMYSIVKQNTGNHHFYFIYANINEKNRHEIIAYAKELRCIASFHKFDKDINALPVNGQNWSIEIYFRLFACYILNNVDKVMYIDADVICMGQLAQLYSIDDMLCAVENDDQSHVVRLGLPQTQKYYNAGVLMMNLQKMRDLYSHDEILSDLFELKDKLAFQDQDFLNIKYGGLITSAPKIYNYMISVAEINHEYSKEENPVLIHYVMEKPWNIKFPYKTDWPYFKIIWSLGKKTVVIKLWFLHRLYRIYQLTLVSKEGRRI